MNERPVDATFPQPEAEVLLAKPEAEVLLAKPGVEIFQQPEAEADIFPQQEAEAFPQIHPRSSVVLVKPHSRDKRLVSSQLQGKKPKGGVDQ